MPLFPTSCNSSQATDAIGAAAGTRPADRRWIVVAKDRLSFNNPPFVREVDIWSRPVQSMEGGPLAWEFSYRLLPQGLDGVLPALSIDFSDNISMSGTNGRYWIARLTRTTNDGWPKNAEQRQRAAKEMWLEQYGWDDFDTT